MSSLRPHPGIPSLEELEPRLLLSIQNYVPDPAPVKVLIPTSSALGTTWLQPGFNDGAWTSGTTGVGFERGTGYEAQIGTDVEAAMYNRNGTAYIRVPFQVVNPAAVDSLTLLMAYDDGFVAYINGTEIARRNAPATLAYNSNASGYHGDPATYETINVSNYISALQTGTNVLAIQGLNASAGSTDFLILPRLDADVRDDLFSVVATTPADGATVTLPPTQITVRFSEPVLAATLAAADLTIDGTPATGAALIAANEVRFDLPAGLASGLHFVSMAPSALQSTTGNPLGAYAGQFTLVGIPTMANLAPTNVLHTSATLRGQVVQTGGQNPDVRIVWGPVDAGTDASAWFGQTVLGPAGVGTFSANVTGLSADTLYYYRVYGINAAGQGWAPSSGTFRTGAVQAPTVTALSSASLTQSSARLIAQVNDTGGQAPQLHIVWGNEQGGTNPANWDHDVNLGTGTAGEHALDVTGLQSEVTYWFSVYAVNTAGTAWATPRAFQALGDDPLISELMALNDSTLADADGDYSDWLEIHNPTAAPLSLAGWYLTDDLDELTQWRFPAVTVPAGGYLVVFASNKDRAVAGQPLHTNFALSGGGEELALVAPDGETIVHAYDFPQQYDDISYGLSPETATPRYFATPTPGAANGTNYWDKVADTKFSVDRGFYDAPFDVTITTATPGAVIRYTLDGTWPTASYGTIYSGPIHVSTTTVVRAIAYKAGFESTNVDTQTYLFLEDVIHQDGAGLPATWPYVDENGVVQTVNARYEMDADIVNDPRYADTIVDDLMAIPTISLVMDWDDLFDPSIGIYANPLSEHDPATGKDWERATSIEYIDPSTGETFQLDSAIRIHGGWVGRSMNHSKRSFRLLFKSEYGASKLSYPLFGEGAVDEFDQIVLRAGGNDTNLMTRDQWAREAALEMGDTAPHGTWVHLYINGLYWGLYNPVERPNAAFASSYLGGEKEEWDVLKKVDLGTEATDGNLTIWFQVMSMCSGGAASQQAYEALKQYVDMDDLADYMLIQFYTNNQDWPGNNWYTGRLRQPGEGFKFFAWDMEYSMLLGSASVNGDKTGSGSTSGPWNPADIYAAARLNPEFRLLFADRVQRHLFNGGALSAERAAETFLEICGDVEDAIVAEAARWGAPATPVSWASERDSLLTNWFPLRTNILLNQLKSRGLYPNTQAAVFSQHGGTIPAGGLALTVGNPNGTGTIYYTTDGSDPRLTGGSVSPTARVYTGTLSLTNETVLKVRIRNGTEWSALNEASYALAIPPDLRVTEVHYNPPASTNDGTFLPQDFEFIELRNGGAATLHLGGVQFVDGITFTFPVMDLAPGQFVLVVRNQQAFEHRYGTGLPVAGVYTGQLDNAGEQIVLATGLGTTILDFEYGDAGNWPQRADGEGSSLEIIDSAGDANQGRNWRASVAYGGSPGTTGVATAGAVVINEVLAHTDLPQQDTIELFNTTGQAIDVSGWWLSDSSADYARFVIPAGTVIPAGGFVAFTEADFNADPSAPGSFALSSSHGETLTLMRVVTGVPVRFEDQVEFGATANGQSLGRHADGQGPLMPLEAFTPGQPNAPVQVGPPIISEILYQPADPGAPEFVEVHNPAPFPVDLFATFDLDGNGWIGAGERFGWKLTGGIEFTFPDNLVLPAGGTVVVVPFDPVTDTASLAAFRQRYGLDASVLILGPYSGQLANEGEWVTLARPDAPPIDEPQHTPYIPVDPVQFAPTAPWPAGAAGGGMSLHRATADGRGDQPAGWTAAAPTPGQSALTLDVAPRVQQVLLAGRAVQYVSTVAADGQVVLTVNFSEPVSINGAHVHLQRLETGQLVSVSLSGLQGTQLQVRAAQSAMPPGHYRLILQAAGVHDLGGGPLDGNGDGTGGDDYALTFHRLPGDVDGDGEVGLGDLATLATWWNQPADATHGDLDGDGQVGLADLAILATGWGQELAPAPVGVAMPVVEPVAAPQPIEPAPRQARPAGRATAAPAARAAQARSAVPAPAARQATAAGSPVVESLVKPVVVDVLAPAPSTRGRR